MFLQTDARWKDLPIAHTTVGKEGCLLVSLCNANLLLGNLVFPDQLAKQLAAVDGFDEEGKLPWKMLQKTNSILWMNMASMEEAIDAMEIIEYERPNNASHFVFVYKGQEIDPKPGTERGRIVSTRRLALIPHGEE